ncbi:hypothetical protein B0T10DRAFT_548386 [Thelonectria olida]|uniref:AMP-dependent synthetase/ligase domain-containing protein n=1 Tax=Thelonectria olida TaxID=1576542 RepID=A0A9P8W4Y0_9HYPO|nr:hypothetical protein B0T10DRAFT_548386 [Thelonectria olida]
MPAPRIYTSPYPSTVIRTDESFWQFILRMNIEDTLPGKSYPRPEYGRHDPHRGKNSLGWLQLEFAAVWAGITAAMVNPIATAHELVHYISVVDAVAIFCDPGAVMSKVNAALGMSKNSGKAKPSIIGLGEVGRASLAVSASSDDEDFSSDINASHDAPLDLSNCDNRNYPAIIHFSSGTSGLPKAAVLSHHNLIAYFLTARSTDPGITNSDQSEVFYAPPKLKQYSVSYLRLPLLTGGYVRLMGEVELIQGYSNLTEGGVCFMRRISAERKQGSVGKLMANMQLRIVDEALQDAPEGTPGEVMFSSPTVFMGYLKNHEANIEVFPFDDGWLRTGDVTRMDSDGFLWLTDRKKDFIKYKGRQYRNQVAPAELESILLSHSEVAEVGALKRGFGVSQRENIEAKEAEGRIVLFRDVSSQSHREADSSKLARAAGDDSEVEALKYTGKIPDSESTYLLDDACAGVRLIRVSAPLI